MRLKNRSLIWSLSFLFLGTGNAAFAKGFLLRYGGSLPHTARYHTVLQGRTQVFVDPQNKQESILKSDMTVTQQSTPQPSGLVRLETRIDAGTMDLNGDKKPIPMLGESYSATIQRNGKVVEAVRSGTVDVSQLQVTLPTQEVSIGDKWTEVVPPSTEVPVSLRAEYRVVGMGEVDGKPCVKIASTIKSQNDRQIEGLDVKVEASGNILFDLQKGQILSNIVQSKLDVILSRIVDKQEQKMTTRMVVSSTTRAVE